jgi:hypothetical protein
MVQFVGGAVAFQFSVVAPLVVPDAANPVGGLGFVPQYCGLGIVLHARGSGSLTVQITCGLPVTIPRALTLTVQSQRDVAHSEAPPYRYAVQEAPPLVPRQSR